MVDARTFQALSDPTRLRILSLLGSGSMNVTAMVEKLDVTQPAVSRHLKVLREAGLIVDVRNGKWVEYSSNPAGVAEAAEYLKALYAAGKERSGAGPETAPQKPARVSMPRVKRPDTAGTRAGAEPGPVRSRSGKQSPPARPGAPAEKTAPASGKSRYVVEREEDFIDDLMI